MSKIEVKIDNRKVYLDKDVYELDRFTIDNRRHFHRNPEPSLKEYKTAEYIRNILSENNIEYKTVGETGTVAIIKGEQSSENKDKVVFLRGDIDALELTDDKTTEYASQNEGLCHACGHDAHTSMLLSTAIVLNNRKSYFSGEVRLAFQQAEEVGAGAIQFVKEGWLNGVDRVFGVHIASNLESGKIGLTAGEQYASCDIFKIKVFGESAHACSPEESNDALFASANIVVQLQSILTRQKSPLDDALISIGKLNSGTRYNVISNYGEIEGTLRTFSNKVRDDILAKLEKTAKITASLNNCEAEFSRYGASNPLINDSESVDYAIDVSSEIFEEENIVKDIPKTYGGEDFSEYLAEAKGCFAQLGTGSSSVPNSQKAHHTNLFDIDERALSVGVNYYVNLAYNYLK